MTAVGTDAGLLARIEEHFGAAPRYERLGFRRIGTARFASPGEE